MVPIKPTTDVDLVVRGGPYAVVDLDGPWVDVDKVHPASRGISVRVTVLERILAVQHTSDGGGGSSGGGEVATVACWLVGDGSGCIVVQVADPMCHSFHVGMDATLVNVSAMTVDDKMQLVMGIYSSLHKTDAGRVVHRSLIKRANNCSAIIVSRLW
jgi:hypothetical protein